MLAAAEADLQAHLIDGLGEQRARSARRRRRKIERQPRQQRSNSAGLMRPQPMTLAPAEEGADLRAVLDRHTSGIDAMRAPIKGGKPAGMTSRR